MKKSKYEKVMVIDGASITPWTVKEVMKELPRTKKFGHMQGNELIEMGKAKLGEHKNTFYQLQVYR